jgi:type I restriction enzyme S subunit
MSKVGIYNKYKHSGLNWLGDVPQHWKVLRVKDIVQRIGSGVTPLGGSEVYVDSGITFIRSQNVYDDGLRLDDVSYITNEVHKKMKSSQLKPNDILINITGASIGRTCIVPSNISTANINQHIIYLRFKPKYVPFISNYFKTISVKDYINLIQAGTSKEALNLGQTLNTALILPPLTEQTEIANYLDTKTQAIDKKINLLTTKIEYYKELRKTIINNAVTIGLDKNVKLKESGIEWIGKIPAHWEVLRGKNLFREYSKSKITANEGNTFNPNSDEKQYKFFTSSNEQSKYLPYYQMNNEAILLSTGGCAGVNYCSNEYSYSTDCWAIYGTNLIFLKFYSYYFEANLNTIQQMAFKGSSLEHLQKDFIKGSEIPFPPKQEQTEIATYLDAKTSTIDKITTNLQTQIETLKELRKTLINDVVTGKVKVN